MDIGTLSKEDLLQAQLGLIQEQRDRIASLESTLRQRDTRIPELEQREVQALRTIREQAERLSDQAALLAHLEAADAQFRPEVEKLHETCMELIGVRDEQAKEIERLKRDYAANLKAKLDAEDLLWAATEEDGNLTAKTLAAQAHTIEEMCGLLERALHYMAPSDPIYKTVCAALSASKPASG
jgi:chromosome segregation ATPase